MQEQVDGVVGLGDGRLGGCTPAGRIRRLLAGALLEPVEGAFVVGLDLGGEAGLGDRLSYRLQKEAVLFVGALAGILAPFQPFFEDFSRDAGGLGTGRSSPSGDVTP